MNAVTTKTIVARCKQCSTACAKLVGDFDPATVVIKTKCPNRRCCHEGVARIAIDVS